MQKYLLLLVCLIATMNARAGFTVVPPEESGTGAYVLTFKETADEGETLHSWAEVTEGGSLGFLRSATSISIVTQGGYQLDQSDVINIIGSYDPATRFPSLVTLDMGEAVLGEDRYLGVMAAKSIRGLKTFVFPKTTRTIPQGMFTENTVIEEIIMLDPDHLEDPHISIIPKDVFKGCTHLSNVRLPNGLEEIGSGAFGHCAFESISFPNTLATIGPNAFEYCSNLKSITIPYFVTSIGNSAFQHNNAMTDVYVLGNNVTIQDGAFNQEETYNFKYQENGSVDFSDWKPTTQGGGTALPLVLHIPNNDVAYANYVNPFLRMLQDPLFDNDDFLEKLKNTTDHPEAKEAVDNLKAQYGITSDIADYAIFAKDHWVKKEDAFGKITKFFKEAGNSFNSDNEVGHNVYGGWRNFMLVEGDVEKKTWPDIRMVDSRWYSAVFPFDLSYNQVETTYGANTDVREFTNVYEHEVNGQLTRTVRFNTRAAIPSATSGGKSEDKNKAGYIVKGRPYMIHPGVRCEVITVTENGVEKKIGRTIAGVDVDVAQAVVNANTDLEEVKRPIVYTEDDYSIGTEDNQKYFFKGTYLKQDMPKNSFYLGYEKDVWPLAFYVRTAVGVGKWSAFTSIVQKTDGSAIQNAKPMDLDFTLIMPEEENFGIATNIEYVAEQKCVNNGVVYNLNGQVIGNQSIDNLSKGIYIVNGKKIVVR